MLGSREKTHFSATSIRRICCRIHITIYRCLYFNVDNCAFEFTNIPIPVPPQTKLTSCVVGKVRVFVNYCTLSGNFSIVFRVRGVCTLWQTPVADTMVQHRMSGNSSMICPEISASFLGHGMVCEGMVQHRFLA